MKKIEEEIKKLIEQIEQLSKKFCEIEDSYGAKLSLSSDGEFIFSVLEEFYTDVYEIETENGIEYINIQDVGLEPYYETGNCTLKDEYKSWYNYTLSIRELIDKNIEILEDFADKLIDLLNSDEQKLYKEKLSAIKIEKIQKKQYITVKEFTEKYGKSSDWQRDRRGRIKNKLPFMQEKTGSNIMYKVEDVEIWFQNNS